MDGLKTQRLLRRQYERGWRSFNALVRQSPIIDLSGGGIRARDLNLNVKTPARVPNGARTTHFMSPCPPVTEGVHTFKRQPLHTIENGRGQGQICLKMP
jgi:hypothetical protein